MTFVVASPSLFVRGARIAFGDRVVATDLTLEFPGGRTTCLLGRSGVGKTSLLRWLAGLLPGTERLQPLAYMAQRDLLLPWLSILDNVLLGYRLRGEATALKAAEPRARTLLGEVGLGQRLSDRPETLSAGMRQRAALARTLCEERAVVLMDEPFGHLDAVTRLELQDLAARLLSGRTVVMVTHDPLEALRLGHQVRVLAGTPFTVGPPIDPPGPIPRDASDPELLALQGQLIAQLRSTA
ncbi:MAG: ATP-binding cassette domain-containing protein [Reyranella sp.]|uniref:ABC transporter ATP-binding protein n=1 Tax=Reyranella sp. TaxID=1929291 RepID=UPI00273037D4|nr:ATP-binding cassette domain-containing protein [Reyranella sp.]MDP1964416.1 ATP-binding cassette domain-containing protein [Reyranella sp.]MDP2373526.1 ATP-binding cassette domain-containing protein [Reyranella sp.]